MADEVNKRIVEMRLDNQQFEKAGKQTMHTLDEMDRKLQFKDGEKGFAKVQKEADKLDFGELIAAVDRVNARFGTMNVLGMTALVELECQALRTGKRMLKGLTLDPVLKGMSEYETKIGSVQTILANTAKEGAGIGRVNAALDELNRYADKTIYNFTEMTRNIGTFTAAGVKLDSSVRAIKGMANLAAMSGSTSQQLNTAMYQTSQALSAGVIRLMDWNSLVNAGMGGALFQDSLMETARVHGIAIDEMLAQDGSFRETLSRGWLTSEVMLETLAKFTGDLSREQLVSLGYTQEQIKAIEKLGKTAQEAATKVKTFSQLKDTLKEALQSGWTESWELMLGDFEEAKEGFSQISDLLSGIIEKSAEARNALLREGFGSGWKQLMGSGLAGQEDNFTAALQSLVVGSGMLTDEEIASAGGLGKALQTSGIRAEQLRDALTLVTQELEVLANLSDEQAETQGIDKSKAYSALVSYRDILAQVNEGTLDLAKIEQRLGRTSGREHLLNGAMNLLRGAGSVLGPIRDGLWDVLGKGGESIYRFLESFDQLTARMKLTDSAAANLERTTAGLLSTLNIGLKGLKLLARGAGAVLGAAGRAANPFLELLLALSGSIGQAMQSLDEALSRAENFGEVLEVVRAHFADAAEAARSFWERLRKGNEGGFLAGMGRKLEAFGEKAGEAGQQGAAGMGILETALAGIAAAAGAIGGTIAGIFNLFGELLHQNGGEIEGFGGKTADELSKAMTRIEDRMREHLPAMQKLREEALAPLGELDIYRLLGLADVGLLGYMIGQLAKSIKSIPIINNPFTQFMQELVGTMHETGGAVKAWAKEKNTEALLNLAKALSLIAGTIAASVYTLSRIDSADTLVLSVAGLLALMAGMVKALEMASAVPKGNILGAMTAAAAMVTLSGTMLSLTAPLYAVCAIVEEIADIGDPLKTVQTLAGAITLMLALGTSFQMLSKSMGSRWNPLWAVPMIEMGAALNLLCSAIGTLGKLPEEELKQGLLSAGGILVTVSAVAVGISALSKLIHKNLKSTGKNLLSSTKGVIQIGAAVTGIVAMIAPVVLLSAIPWTSLLRGFAAMSVGLVGISAVLTQVSKKTKGIEALSLAKVAVSIALVAAAIEAMILPVVTLANIPWEKLSVGFSELSIGLTVLGGLLTLLSGQGRGWNMVAMAAAMGLLAGSLLMMVPAITAFNLVDWSALGKAAAVIGGMLAALLATAAVIGFFPHLAGGLLSLAAAFGAFGVALGTLSLATAALGVLALFAGPVCSAILNAAPDIEAALIAVVQVLSNVIILSAEPISKALVAAGMILIVTIAELLDLIWDTASEKLDGIWGEFIRWLQEHNLLEAIGNWLYELPLIHQATDLIMGLGRSAKVTGEEMAALFGGGLAHWVNGLSKLTGLNLGEKIVQGMLGVTDEQLEEMKANAEQDGQEIGEAYTQGTAQGMNGAQDVLANAAKDAVGTVQDTTQKAAGINSPSKMMEENGYYMTLGLAVGLTNSEAKGTLFSAVEKLCRMLDERFCDWWGIHSASDTMIAHAGDMALGIHDGLTDEHATTLLQNGMDGASRTLEERFRDRMAQLKGVVGEQTDQVMETIRAKWDPDGAVQSWLGKKLPEEWATTYFGKDKKEEDKANGKSKKTGKGGSGKTLAQQLEEKHKKLLEANRLLRETAEQEYALWTAEHQHSAREDELLTKKAENAATLITIQTERVALAQKQYDEMVQRLGADKQETKESYLALLKEQTSLAELKAEQYVGLFEQAASRYDTDLAALEKEYGLWTAQNQDSASEADKINRETEYLTAQLSVREKLLKNAQEQYDTLAREVGAEDARAREAQLELLDAKKEHQELLNQLAQQELDLIQAELTSIQDLQAVNSSRMNRLQKMYGDGSLASRSQDYKAAVEKYGAGSDEARRAQYQGTMSAILDAASATQGLTAQMKQTLRYQKLYNAALEKAGGDRTNSQVLAAEKQLASSQASFVDYAGSLADAFGMDEAGKRLMMQLANAIQQNGEVLAKGFASVWKRVEEKAPQLAEGLSKAIGIATSQEGMEIGAGMLAAIAAGLQGDYANALVSGLSAALQFAGSDLGQRMLAGFGAALQNGEAAIAGMTGALGQAGGAMSGLVAGAGALLPEILPVLAAVTAIGLVLFGIYKLAKKLFGEKPEDKPKPQGGYPTGGSSGAKPVVQMTLAPAGVPSGPYDYGPRVDDDGYGVRMARGVTNAAAWKEAPKGFNDSGIREEIRALEGRMAQVGEAIEGLQMVTDTGKLVGEMAPKMDKKLGDMARRSGRGRG